MSISIRFVFLVFILYHVFFFVAYTRCHSRRYWVLCLQNYFLFELCALFIYFPCPPLFFSALSLFLWDWGCHLFCEACKEPFKHIGPNLFRV